MKLQVVFDEQGKIIATSASSVALERAVRWQHLGVNKAAMAEVKVVGET